jgi:hypothetical protein
MELGGTYFRTQDGTVATSAFPTQDAEQAGSGGPLRTGVSLKIIHGSILGLYTSSILVLYYTSNMHVVYYYVCLLVIHQASNSVDQAPNSSLFAVLCFASGAEFDKVCAPCPTTPPPS